MKIVFVRHGDCDKSCADERGFIGMGRDMSPMTELGVKQAKAAAENPMLDGCQLIVSSPYTRALQTAAIVSLRRGLEINVEIDMHEFLPDRTFRVASEEDAKVYHDEFKVCCGEHPAGETRNWETISELVARTRRVLDRYLEAGYEKIAVVGHGGLIRRYTGERVIGYCHVSEIEYTKDFVCFDWVP